MFILKTETNSLMKMARTKKMAMTAEMPPQVLVISISLSSRRNLVKGKSTPTFCTRVRGIIPFKYYRAVAHR